jgi:cytochrome c553
MRTRRLAAALLAFALAPLPASAGDPAEAARRAFFESRIRPVLVAKCYSCHSAAAQAAGRLKGGLRLDTREALLVGGDGGPAVEPGKPEESPLLAAIRYDDATRMPPEGRLPADTVAAFERWIADGAFDPRADEAGPASTAPAPAAVIAARDHWAYRPVRVPALPPVRDSGWPRDPIDHFVLARLEAAGLRPGPEATRAVLARRLAFDLTGLPPAPEELDAFEADTRPDAYERLVDRLLASPRFGDRWGRHWLDLARFAESLTLRGIVREDAWRYRDFVVGAFNAGRPFDVFLRMQIAGDLLPADSLDERRANLVAAGFLALGDTNLEEQDKLQLDMDVVDEQLDTIGKAVLGQTIGCARCHDHKFDPIPTRDYYAMAGILANVQTLEHANVSKGIARPLPLDPADEAALAAHEARLADLDAAIGRERARDDGDGGSTGVLAAAALPGVVVDDADARQVGAWTKSTHSRTYIGEGYLHDDNAGKGERSLTFEPVDLPPGRYEVRLAYSPGPGRADGVPVTVAGAEGERTVPVDLRAAPPIAGRFVALGRFRFERGGLAYVLVSNAGTAGHVAVDAVQFLPEAEADAPASRGGPSRLAALEGERAALARSGPVREQAPGVRERDAIRDARVNIRGSVHRPGEVVPRGFLSAVAPAPAGPLPADASGRRELADWLASPENPLTARVFANRAWHWLFGAGLVRTPDEFGTTGEPPSHPDLLDHLAGRFVADGWSVKRLVRAIVLSRSYRLAAGAPPASDPENRLIARRLPRRLDAESLRDAMLAAAATMHPARGGRTFPAGRAADYGYEDDGTRPRASVDVPAFRNARPDLLTAFDAADPGRVVGRRDASTIAPQALLLLNDPFVRDQARQAARRALAEPGDDPARLDRLVRRALGRGPSPGEAGLLRAAVAHAPPEAREDAWTDVAQALFGSIDFRYLD